MEKKMNNKGFSLVELIIVVAIMAVLIGVLAPAYLQYVEKSKKTTDASAIGSVLDAFEIVAADPAVNWPATASNAVTVSITSSGSASFAGKGSSSPVEALVDDIVDGANCKLTGSWSGISFTAEKQANGTVKFTINSGSSIKKTNGSEGFNLDEISKPLAARFAE